jgi:proteasome accessory factor C
VTPFERRLRRLLLLIPAARASERGLTFARACALTGARSVEELRDDVAAVQDVAAGTDPDAPHLLLSIEEGRVHVDLEMGFSGPLPFSLREAAALLAALRPFARTGGQAVARAGRRLRAAAPEHLRAEVEALARTTALAAEPPGEWAEALEEAMARRLEVEVEYRAESTGAVGRRTLEPRTLFPRDGSWYLAAWNPARGAEHLYRLDRVLSVVVGTRCFGEHKGPPLERYGPRPYLASGQERRVVLRFAPEAAQAARERHGEACRDLPGGGVEAAVTVAPNEFFLARVLAWGGACEVVDPPDVRAALRARVAALRARHAGPGPDPE